MTTLTAGQTGSWRGRYAAGVLPTVRSTPGRLRLLRAALVALALLLAAVTFVAVRVAANGTHATTRSAEPLLLNSETIYSSLADADTTSAQAFLSGGLEPATQTARYTADIARVGNELAQAAGRVGPNGPATNAVRTLAAQLPVYAGLIQTARANNRQGLPVGASYFAKASTALRAQLLPAADQLFGIEQRQLAADYDTARADPWLAAATGFAVALLVVLAATQLFLIRRTHRVLNPGLLAATVALLLLAGLMTSVLLLQRHRLADAQRTGSDPIGSAARARITALIQHGDESLTLISRGASSDYENDFFAVEASLLGDASHPALLQVGTTARLLEQTYLGRHAEIRALDDSGDYNGAVALATSTAPTGAAAAFAALDQELSQTLAADHAHFSAAARHADAGLSLLTILAPLLAVAICAASVLGIRPRLEEYR
jgi:hypothetical protein